MRIYKEIKFKGAKRETAKKSLIDTGAEISLIPINLAINVGAWRTHQNINIRGVHGLSRNLPIGKIGIFFPDLGNKGTHFLVAVSDVKNEPIIGMDVLKPIGISINTRTHELSVKNETWEAFKNLAAAGVLIFAGIKVVEELFEEE